MPCPDSRLGTLDCPGALQVARPQISQHVETRAADRLLDVGRTLSVFVLVQGPPLPCPEWEKYGKTGQIEGDGQMKPQPIRIS